MKGRSESNIRFIIGLNYWPRKHPIKRMWKEFNIKELEEEAKQISSIGVNTLRIFLFTPDFSNEAGDVLEESLFKLKQFVRTFYKYGIRCLVTLLVGHMSGCNWKIPWHEGCFYTDENTIKKTLKYISQIINALKGEKGVLGYILSNELPFYAGLASESILRKYLSLMFDHVKKLDPNKTYSTGDGLFIDYGYHPEIVKDYVDYLGPHVYGDDIDEIRRTYHYEFWVEYCSSLDKPVILEEFGCSTAQVPEEEQANIYRIAMFSTLIAGGKGFIGWCYSDFPTELDEPYIHHCHELMFGVTRVDGSLKQAAYEIKRFSRLISEVGLEDFKKPTSECAILVPSCIYKEYPFSQYNFEKKVFFKVLIQAYTLARMASILATFIREEDPLEKYLKYKCILIPTPITLLSKTWRKLEEYVRRGGLIYSSYTWNLRCHIIRELFGVELDVAYGIIKVPEANKLTLRIIKRIGDLEAGSLIEFIAYRDVVNPKLINSYTSIKKTFKGADIIGHVNGTLALSMNLLSKGKAILMTYPVEYYAVLTYNFNFKSDYYRLYHAIAKEAKVNTPFKSLNPYVEVGYLEAKHKGREYLLVVLNHLHDYVSTRIVVKGAPSEIVDVEKKTSPHIRLGENKVEIALALKPMEVRIFKVKY